MQILRSWWGMVLLAVIVACSGFLFYTLTVEESVDAVCTLIYEGKEEEAKAKIDTIKDIDAIGSNKETYNDSMVESYRNAYVAENRYIADIDMDDIYNQNIEIFTNEYKEYKNSGKIVAAGFPWSISLPDGSIDQGYTFQMGFVGQQIPAAYHCLSVSVLPSHRRGHGGRADAGGHALRPGR